MVCTYRSDLSLHDALPIYLYLNTGRHLEAEQSYQAALSIWTILAEEQPALTEFAVGLASTQAYLGNLFRERGQLEQAVACHAEAIATLEAVFAKQAQYTYA